MPLALTIPSINTQSIIASVENQAVDIVQQTEYQAVRQLQNQINSFFGALTNSTIGKTSRLSSAPLALDFRSLSVTTPSSPTLAVSTNAAALSSLFTKKAHV